MMMEKQINRKTEYLGSVFDSIFDEVLILDKNYKITNVNRTFDGKIWIEDKVDGDYTQGSNIMILVKAAHHTVRKDIKNGIPLTDHR